MSVVFLTNEDKTELEQKIKANADTTSKLSEEMESIKNGGMGTGTGITSTLASLFITLFRKAVFTENMSGKIDELEAELNNSSSGGSSGNEGESGDGNEDTPTVTDDITVSNGVMTIISVGSEITVSDGVMVIA